MTPTHPGARCLPINQRLRAVLGVGSAVIRQPSDRICARKDGLVVIVGRAGRETLPCVCGVLLKLLPPVCQVGDRVGPPGPLPDAVRQ